MELILMVIGASIFGILGTLHLLLTCFSNQFEAYDPSVTSAMKNTSPKLTRETTLWDAWVGFNVSHSLGAMLLAAFYIPLAIWHAEVIRGSFWFSALPVLVGLSYLYLAKKYWFKTPFIGILISTLCFIGAFVLVIQR
ncbi:LIC_13387 family protein [Aliikangiella coralliicola]|uniref:LIC_13387 family protein n=1 Tax=Aliikangiella coralliicola TaxID=2592383 RepID=UPI001AEFC9A4|nr:hypothetical protein [Aliikangiella coralliicola]